MFHIVYRFICIVSIISGCDFVFVVHFRHSYRLPEFSEIFVLFANKKKIRLKSIHINRLIDARQCRRPAHGMPLLFQSMLRIQWLDAIYCHSNCDANSLRIYIKRWMFLMGIEELTPPREPCMCRYEHNFFTNIFRQMFMSYLSVLCVVLLVHNLCSFIYGHYTFKNMEGIHKTNYFQTILHIF